MSLKDYPPQPGRNGYVILKSAKPDQYTMVRDCPFCGRDARLQIPAQGLWDWEHGTFVQDAFPDLSAPDREQLISGIHPGCWDRYVKEEEED